MLKLYKPEDWTRKNKKEGMKELTGGPMEENEPAKSKKNSPPPGFEPQAKKISKKISPPPGFEPQAKKTAPTKPPPKTAPTNPPPKPEEKQKR